ncbi:radical SAM protein [Acidaminobacter hydrogenoformans]|uniref:Pyruvate-formate lyase-activating enzyme n=1 Tax=Acidaminobacter hydrogenoformans DSM 2784 TaxID=1120920 RepID=A0A1G5RWB6_9FIRM|nr:radical SAM protein [Acidaminobacter hydrogenoformans]SCZ78343.1 Pyruvate-formate lyase-activating enzyme [Acidaminobacter hydrogenoformans DSM 2784]
MSKTVSDEAFKGYVKKILPFSSVDGPGNRSIIFLQGCSFRCGYCHNPETIALGSAVTTGEIRLRTPDDVVQEVLKYKSFISGVTISGGECTLQPEFLLALVKALKKEAFHILIDTNGDFDQAYYERLRPWVDGFMLDVKSIDPEAHKKLAGEDNQKVIENLHRMAGDRTLYEVRTVIVPDWPDNTATVTSVSKVLAEKSPSTRYKLIRFRPHGVVGLYKALPMPKETEMENLKKIASDAGLSQVILV